MLGKRRLPSSGSATGAFYRAFFDLQHLHAQCQSRQVVRNVHMTATRTSTIPPATRPVLALRIRHFLSTASRKDTATARERTVTIWLESSQVDRMKKEDARNILGKLQTKGVTTQATTQISHYLTLAGPDADVQSAIDSLRGILNVSELQILESKVASGFELPSYVGPQKYDRPPAGVETARAAPTDDAHSFAQHEKETTILIEDELPKSQVADQMRLAMRSVVNPVAVVTCLTAQRPQLSTPRPTDRFSDCVGSTISSLSSVTLQPVPVISFNLYHSSKTWKAIAVRGYCDVHLLLANKYGMRIAQVFAARKDLLTSAPFESLQTSGEHTVTIRADEYVRLRSPGVMAILRCRYLDTKPVRVGDHMVVFCEIMEVLEAKNTADNDWESLQHPLGQIGLAYADRQYGTFFSDLRSTDTEVATRSTVPPSKIEPTPGNDLESNTTAEAGGNEAARLEGTGISWNEPQELTGRSTDSSGTDLDRAYARIKAETDRYLAPLLAQRGPDGPQSETTRGASVRQTRNFSSRLRIAARQFSVAHQPTPRHHHSHPSTSSHRQYSKDHTPSTEGDTPGTTAAKGEDPEFLKKTVAEFFALDSYETGRWVNRRLIRELEDYGPAKVQEALRSSRPGASRTAGPDGPLNTVNMRITSLIARLHQSQKQGHIPDEVMERLIVGGAGRDSTGRDGEGAEEGGPDVDSNSAT